LLLAIERQSSVGENNGIDALLAMVKDLPKEFFVTYNYGREDFYNDFLRSPKSPNPQSRISELALMDEIATKLKLPPESVLAVFASYLNDSELKVRSSAANFLAKKIKKGRKIYLSEELALTLELETIFRLLHANITKDKNNSHLLEQVTAALEASIDEGHRPDAMCRHNINKMLSK
jgi:hypothetical protein